MSDDSIKISLQLEPEADGLPLPEYKSDGSAGMDLFAALPVDSPCTIDPGKRVLISTGLRIALPLGYEAQVRPRSGLALRYGIGVVNSPGTIDSDYRGVVQIILINWGDSPVTIQRGDRIAQLVIAPIARGQWIICERLQTTVRGDGGFGSTGMES